MRIEILGKCLTWNNLLNKTAFSWANRKRLADEWKELTYWSVYTTENKPELPFKKKVDLEFLVQYKDKRRRDPDGVSVKYICDGLVNSGVLKDDSYKEIRSVKIRIEVGAKEDKVILDIIQNMCYYVNI